MTEDQSQYEIKAGQHGKGCECGICNPGKHSFLNDIGHTHDCQCVECQDKPVQKNKRQAFRDCDTCGRTENGQCCSLPDRDTDTCLRNPSRPSWVPKNATSPAWEKKQEKKAEQAAEFVRDAWTVEKGITNTQWLIRDECHKIMDKLLEKNRKYGDSAINPVRVFSKADPAEQINVRLDDKISRIMSGQTDDDEDVEFDLIGYLILRRVQRRAE